MRIYLTPSWRTQTDSEDRKQPCMGFTEPREDTQEQGPDTNEECDDEKKNLPLGDGDTP